MGSGARPTLRFPLMLLAIANLAVLGARLWPWQDVPNLPLNGATGIDPAVCLLGYIGIIFWFGSNSQEPMQKALGTGTSLGFLGGCFLVAEILLKGHAPDANAPSVVTMGLFAAAGVLWGIAGLRAMRLTGNAGLGMLCGAWSALTSCLMAATAVLTQVYYTAPPAESPDPWKQYEGLAIGNPAMQGLVHSLNSVTFFLLVGPLAGAAIGLFFAFFGHKGED
ncbi:MAG: hypothetical protein ABSE87_04380 [Terracidiphilus sp.]